MAFGYLTAVLHFAPAKLSGFEVCPNRTRGCTLACLNTAGRGGIAKGGMLTYESVAAGKRNEIQAARIRKTQWYFNDRTSFMAALVKEIRRFELMARELGLKPAIRLNGTSDIPWERVKTPMGNANVMCAFPDVQFYDYTKRANRKDLPRNYSLTYSLAEDNDEQARVALLHGMNVAAVFRKVPNEYALPGGNGNPYRVINGDEHDLRFLDERHCIVGLKAKGNAKRDTSGFVR
ncbi:MAG TPA: hypothetical protein VFQ26_02950 [Nitrospiraceae bacterium]|nr:hypothetical protein [Nitrospiraceae bacterium]